MFNWGGEGISLFPIYKPILWSTKTYT